MSSLKRLQFSTTVAVSPARLIEVMTGPESYRQWTSVFAEGSCFEGSWEQGQRIRFLSPSGDGMVSEIAVHRPNEFISIRHLGFIVKGAEDTESEAVRAWAPAYENYTFTRTLDGTQVVVDQDVPEDWESHLAEAWPKALAKLKSLCEAGSAA
jgi:uncharacterized protein YndB with AHSA1/START domain